MRSFLSALALTAMMVVGSAGRAASSPWASGAAPRQVDCSNAMMPINQTIQSWYAFAFADFEDIPARQGKWTLIFEAVDALAAAGTGGADVLEFLVTLTRLSSLVASSNVTVAEVRTTWTTQWATLGQQVWADAVSYESEGQLAAAASAYSRASNYLALAERFMEHLDPSALALYNQSVVGFERSLSLSDSTCVPVGVPYTSDGVTVPLHAYWCPSQQNGSAPRATIVAMTGYDGSAEMTMRTVGFAAAAQGYNVLVFDGPGQGYAPRFQGLLFRPDWEFVVEQVVAWAKRTLPTVDPARIVLWGRSFGGVLVPRAFSKDPSYLALVADGGIYDFYQNFICSLPASLQQVWYSNVTQFSNTMGGYAQYSLPLQFLSAYGSLGFGATNFGEIYWAMQNYTMAGLMEGIGARPVLVNNPALDNLLNNQSTIFFDNLPTPLHDLTTLQSLDPARGAGLHCSVGAYASVINAQLAWLNRVVDQA